MHANSSSFNQAVLSIRCVRHSASPGSPEPNQPCPCPHGSLQHLPVPGTELGGETRRWMSSCEPGHGKLTVQFRVSAENGKRQNIVCSKLGRILSLLLYPKLEWEAVP